MRTTENAVVKAVGQAMGEVNLRVGKLRDRLEGKTNLSTRSVAARSQKTFGGITDIIRKQIADAFIESYYRECYEVQDKIGRYWRPPTLSQSAVNAFVNGQIKGKNWKERLQRWYRQYARAISTITHGAKYGIPQGEIDDLIKRETGKQGESGLTYKIMRIVRTESNNAMNRAAIMAYKAMGVQRYRIVAILDDRTCRYCHEEQDGKIYEVAKAKKTINLPPFHPNCRCYTEPVITKDTKKQARKKAKLKKHITYAVWRKRYT